MSNSIRDEKSQENKEKLFALIKEAGYENYSQFCHDIGIDQSNLYSNLDGTWKISVKRMFLIANSLGVSITRILEIFFPEEYAENQKLL